MVLHGDPMDDVSVAPAVSWAMAAWQALVAPERALFSIRDLTRMFHTVQERMEPHHTWRNTKGPISRMLLSFKRAQWQAKSFGLWIYDRGVEISLLYTAPQMWRGLLKDAVQRKHERDMASSFEHERVCVRMLCVSTKACSA